MQQLHSAVCECELPYHDLPHPCARLDFEFFRYTIFAQNRIRNSFLHLQGDAAPHRHTG